MSLRINHNISAINSHRNLLNNDKGLSDTLEKLSSGLKINRAADGPASLVISEQMRSQIAGLRQAIDNSETGVSMVQTTEANLNEVNRLLISMRQLAIHAANEGVNDTVMLEADQAEMRNGIESINRISEQAQFGTKKLLDGSNGTNGVTTGQNLQFMKAGLETGDSSKTGFDVTVTQAATKTHVTGTTGLTQELVNAGETFTVIENGLLAKYTTNENDTVGTAVQNLRSQIVKNGLNVDIGVDESGLINIKHKEYGSSHGFQMSSSTEGVLSQAAGQIEVATAGEDVAGKINGESAIGAGQILRGIDGAKNVDGLEVRYTGDLSEVTEETPLGGKVGQVFISQNATMFQIGANYMQTAGISIEGTHTRELGRNIANDSGYENISGLDVRTFQGAQDALLLIDSAVNKIAADRGHLGAFQKNTLEANLQNLRVANENLTSAESVLRDVDMAAEMATFTKNQIMSQSATAMLAQANQIPAQVLTLLG